MALKLFMPGADPGFPVGGAPTLQWWVPTYDFAKFSEKLHEIEKNLGRGGGGLLPGAPLDPPLHAKCQEYSVHFFILHKCLTSVNDINIDKLMFEIGVTLN